ncbi:MAG TPA: MFS transporter [Stellaceae bacterium]|nr:MFS transporter [Stellaceae bacterium]
MTVANWKARQIVAVAVGNALEWYDFAIYGYVAVTISKLFFPPETGWAPLLATFGLFAVSYVVRPVGGILLGHYADQYGRKALLVFVIGLMSVASAMIAAAPTYQMIGVAAPSLIVVARVLQGLAAGGVFGSATAFLVEHAPAKSRGLYGSWQFSGQGAAIMLSGVVGMFVTHYLDPRQLESWGWRLPFLLGLVLGPIGVYIRFKLSETPEFLEEQSRRGDGRSVISMIATYKYNVLIGLGLVVGGTAAFYVLFVFMPTYSIRVLHLGSAVSFLAIVAAGLTVAICCPLMGLISDRIGRWPVMMAAATTFLVVVYPGFRWLQVAPSGTTLVMLELGFGFLFAAYAGPGGATIAALYPVQSRATAMAIAYNVAVAVFGGGAPIIVTWLIARTGDPIAPAYYVMTGVFISVLALAAMRSLGAVDEKGLHVNSGPLLGMRKD